MVTRGILLASALWLAFLAPTKAQTPQGCVSNALAGGTVNAISIPLQPCALSTNLLILTASGANTGATTLQMSGYPALPVEDSQGNAIGAGTIPGAGAVVLLTSTGSAWKIVSGNATTGFTGVLTVPNGGTGLSTITTNSPLIGEGTGNVSTITPGTTGQFLGGNTGSPPSFKSLASNVVTSWSAGSTGFTPNSATQGAVTLAGTLVAGNGGTGFASYTTGDTLYASSSSALSKLGIGTSGQYYKVVGGLPAWATLSSDAVTTISFGTTGLTPSSATSGAVTVAGTLATANGGTGQTSYTNGQLLIGNTGTGSLSKSTLTAGSNVTITNGAGSVTISSTGLASGCGTSPNPAGYVLTSDGAGACTSNSGVTVSGGTSLAASGTLTAGTGLTVSAGGAAITGNSSITGTTGLTGATTQTGAFNLAGASSPLQVGGSAGSSGNLFTSAGAGNTPTWTAATGVAVTSLSFGTTGLTPNSATQGAITVAGTLGVANGGTGVATLTGIPLFAGTANITAATAGTDYAKPSVASTWTALQSFTGASSNFAAALTNAKEPATVSATAATGTINYDLSTQSIIYYTSNASANWTVNFRCSSGTTLNTCLTTGDVVTAVFAVTQGGTPFYNNTLQVDGNAVTPKCPGGCPSAGNASGVDIYTYSIFKTGSAAFTVFETQVQYK